MGFFFALLSKGQSLALIRVSLDRVPHGFWILGCAEKCLLKRTPKGKGVLQEEISWMITEQRMTDFQLGLDASDTRVDHKIELEISVQVLLL